MERFKKHNSSSYSHINLRKLFLPIMATLNSLPCPLATPMPPSHWNSIFANLSKCLFAFSQVENIGHIISASIVKVDPSKVDVMLNWTTSKIVKALWGFLGLMDHYNKFFQGYGSISWPLKELLKKDKLKWSIAATIVFDKHKFAMSTIPVLVKTDFPKPFAVTMNASRVGMV